MMSLEPVFSNSHQPFYFARYRAHVTIGTYVKYHSGSSSYVGRILEVRGPQIVVNRFVRRQKLSHPELIVAGSITSESCRYMTEVFQTSGMDLVGSSDVSDISFVFKETDIEAGGGRMDMCQGVSNAYVIRYTKRTAKPFQRMNVWHLHVTINLFWSHMTFAMHTTCGLVCSVSIQV